MRYKDTATPIFPPFDDPTGRGSGWKTVRYKAGKSYRGMPMSDWDWRVASREADTKAWLETQFLIWVRGCRLRVKTSM